MKPIDLSKYRWSTIADDGFSISWTSMNKPRPLTPTTQIIVKFYTADAKVFTQSYANVDKVSTIKEQFVELFGIPYENIVLLVNDEPVADGKRLGKLKVDSYGTIEMKLLSNHPDYKFHVENVYKNLTVPDILTVSVETEDEGTKEVVVEVENLAIEKPNLGGFRHIRTGVSYFNAYSQTGPPKPRVPPEMKNHRDTQTYFMRHRRTEKEYARATQVATKDIYIPNCSDKILTAGPYETADEREKRLDVEGKIRVIQRYYRAWKIRQCLELLSEEYHKRMRLQREREEREQQEDDARKKRDLIRKVFPMTSADFAMLYTMLDRWKKSEIARITAFSCGPSKIAELYLLLEKEVDMLRTIESIRRKLDRDMEDKNIVNFFKAIGNPIEWDSDYKHLHIVMDSIETQKGREYFALYKTLRQKKLTTEEKLKVYLNIKSYLEDHECMESQDIVDLIDRICKLLARGMEQKFLHVLEKRIETMVFQHFKVLECNEGVTRHMLKTRQREMKKSLIYCHHCEKLKTVDAFTLNARLEKIKVCTSCKWIETVEEPWIDLSPYRFILKQIRDYERLHHAVSSVAFILQDKDIHHIITYIWHGHSALSECTDIYQLRLVRWIAEQEWSPWNCILLTAEESRAHLKIECPEKVYEEEFRNHIFNKHALAKKHFWQLKGYDRHFTEMARGDPKLDEYSDYYVKPVHDCLFDLE